MKVVRGGRALRGPRIVGPGNVPLGHIYGGEPIPAGAEAWQVYRGGPEEHSKWAIGSPEELDAEFVLGRVWVCDHGRYEDVFVKRRRA